MGCFSVWGTEKHRLKSWRGFAKRPVCLIPVDRVLTMVDFDFTMPRKFQWLCYCRVVIRGRNCGIHPAAGSWGTSTRNHRHLFRRSPVTTRFLTAQRFHWPQGHARSSPPGRSHCYRDPPRGEAKWECDQAGRNRYCWCCSFCFFLASCFLLLIASSSSFLSS